MTLGDDFEDHDVVSDYIYALDYSLLGAVNSNTTGVISQADYDIQNDTPLPADGEVVATVRAPGADEVVGQARSTGQWSLTARWLDAEDNIIRQEGISSNNEAGRWVNFALNPKSPFVRMVVEDDSSADQVADLSVNLR